MTAEQKTLVLMVIDRHLNSVDQLIVAAASIRTLEVLDHQAVELRQARAWLEAMSTSEERADGGG